MMPVAVADEFHVVAGMQWICSVGVKFPKYQKEASTQADFSPDGGNCAAPFVPLLLWMAWGCMQSLCDADLIAI